MNIAGFSEVQNLRYVGDIKGFSNAKMVVIFKATYSPA